MGIQIKLNSISCFNQTAVIPRKTNNWLQVGYSKVVNNNISLNVAIAKQQVSRSINTKGRNETVTSFSVSIPIGSLNNYNSSLGLNYSYSKDMGSKTQASLTGQLSQDNNINYSLGLNNLNKTKTRSISRSLQKNFSKANLGINASKGKHYWQTGANIQGAIALHSGGVTLGPYLGDTFALVEAKGAESAHFLNAQDTTIGSNGFALVPTLYQYNSILIDPKDTNNTIEFLENEKRVAPYAGSTVRVSFSTKFGYPLLIKVNEPNKTIIPLGTEVKNSSNVTVGMIGQNNQVYMRAEKLKDKIHLSWGNSSSDSCTFYYNVAPFYHDSNAITQLTVNCYLGG
ncbi:fimbria/pilus outer membrane usher protein [Providencia rettgeri]|uniref:fimbria/pilus outer membrane usher protein n=1 Tax=Providencia rettgeri TaxID=587 RepID=UPI003D29A385